MKKGLTIVERLRFPGKTIGWQQAHEAAREIERLEANCARMADILTRWVKGDHTMDWDALEDEARDELKKWKEVVG